MRPRLLFISNLFPDAAEPYRGLDNATLLHHLHEKWDIRVVALRPSLRAWLGKGRQSMPRRQDASLQPLFLPVRYVPKLGGWFNHRLILSELNRELPGLKERFPWDVVLASWLFPDGWAAIQAVRVPCVLIAQGSDVHRYLRSPARRRAILEAVDQSRGVVTRSRSLATLLAAAGAAVEKLHPIANGVDLNVFRPGTEPAKVRKVILFVGNLLPVKNPDMLLRAFAKVAGEPRLLVAGKGPLRSPLEGLADSLGIANRVQFLGPLRAEQIAVHMQNADVLCLSSHNEGLPNVVIEAMACGLPVVATNVGGIHEVIDAPWKGLLVPPGDEAALTTALNEALTHPLDRARIAAYGQGFSWQQTAEACDAVLRAAVSHP